MQSMLEEASQALQQERFDRVSTLVGHALASTNTPADRLALLEILAPA